MTEPPCILPSKSKKMKPGQVTLRGSGILEGTGNYVNYVVQGAASYDGDGGRNGPHPKLLRGPLAVVELAPTKRKQQKHGSWKAVSMVGRTVYSMQSSICHLRWKSRTNPPVKPGLRGTPAVANC